LVANTFMQGIVGNCIKAVKQETVYIGIS